MSDGQTKQFGKGQRLVPAQKAQKWYPVDDESQPKKVSEDPGGFNTIDLRETDWGRVRFARMNAIAIAPELRTATE